MLFRNEIKILRRKINRELRILRAVEVMNELDGILPRHIIDYAELNAEQNRALMTLREIILAEA